MSLRQPPDQAQRDAAIAERARNVVIDAGAGTGKTTILVRPPGRDGGARATARRPCRSTASRPSPSRARRRASCGCASASGCWRELAEAAGSPREALLRDALGRPRHRPRGTIHGFADRLLRLRPVEAELSPSYEVVEDDGELVRETFDVLLQAVEGGTLAARAGRHGVRAARAEGATRTVLDALRGGARGASPRSASGTSATGWTRWSRASSATRDVPPPDAPPVALRPGGVPAARRRVHAARRAAWRPRRPAAPGSRARRDVLAAPARASTTRRVLPRAAAASSTGRRAICRRARTSAATTPRGGRGRSSRTGDKDRDGALRDDLQAPLHRWLATRLVRLFPVVVALYEKVKARQRQASTQLDLLVKLRDLLRGRPRGARRATRRCSTTSSSTSSRTPTRCRPRSSSTSASGRRARAALDGRRAARRAS